ncbi:ketoacyl-synt-domain-containing protein [Coniochaeta ligniaria NRRL 30616]|uniref:Ketoacyl-synt-domain-containing protein n=1 Tax=Coniochaeta ligniaria NRRL 30616 TaxID=1408157 RepID=A0A1J7JRY6_9PEZI|nr:ketoacyl-synt-domain-containing protein [Coniochaeta ligniaria NRRL 30616]
MDNERREAVAIIGMACRFPGGAHNPEQLFSNLEAGQSAWCEFPSDRLNIDGFYHPSPQRHDSFTFKGAHFLTGNIAAFDAEFFSMSATESNSTDVQQRILLEVAYEAVENAGIPKETLAGSDASVYIGSFVKDYEQVSMRDAQYLAADCATGNGIAIMSNRISYFFDIHGPSMTIDTGCSASLICIHQAVQSLLSGESSMAMAGGAGMILTPSTIMPMVSLGFLSKDGKCYTFDSRANGYGRGEGVGIVVLKRLSDAIRDNDTIRGVIRGTSTNQDGRTSGITMPSSEAQVINIRKCYASAGLGFDQTMFVECHGTGTQAGDPRELKAISDALCNERPADNPMVVGSIKTNIGHLEGSAGVAGVIKAVMTIEKGRIPRHINFKSWNPDINHRRLKVNVALKNTEWPTSGLRRISVNSFGFGGSNAHAIIDDAAHYLEQQVHVVANHNTRITSAEDPDMDISMNVSLEEDHALHPYLYWFSANDQDGIARLADAHLSSLTSRKTEPFFMRDYAYTLSSRRSRLQYKAFAVARSHEELMSELARIKTSQPFRSQKSRALNLAFIFCGQGAQWSRMGLDLCIFEPFRRSLKDSIALIKTLTLDRTFDLLTTLTEAAIEGSSPKINNPIYAQPATTAIQLALVDLLAECGVKPTAVLGHSSGEIAAAYAAGMISKLGALTIAYFRGKVASHVQLKGSMLAVNLSSADAQKYVNIARDGSVCVACINSPDSVTLSGDTDQIRQIQESLTHDGIASKLLSVETAYHSHHMQTVSKEYQFLLTLYLRKSVANPNGPVMFSSVTGQRISHADLTPSYWVNNMVSPVEFEKAVSAMIKAEKTVRPGVFLEVSPQSVLRKALSETVGSGAAGDDNEIPYFPMMDQKKDGTVTVINTLGKLWVRGLPVQLDWLHQGSSGEKPKCLVDLPTYPWDHSKAYWHESHLSKAHRFRKFGSHDFLGAMTADSITPQEPRWRGFIDITENPWIEHHKIQKKTMYPAAGMVVMAVEAAKQLVDGAVDSPSDILDFEISDFKIEEPMIIPEKETRLEYNFNATRVEESTADRLSTWRYSFTIYSILDTSSAPPYQHTTNARGTFAVRFRPRGLGETNGNTREIGLDDNLQGLQASSSLIDFADGMNPREFYERLNIIGLGYGRLFRNITKMGPAQEVSENQSTKYCWTKVQIPNTKAVMPEEYETPATIHPATLDAMFQSLFVLGDEPMVPYFIESIRISANAPQEAGTEFLGYSEAKRKGLREAVSNIIMWQDEDRQRQIVNIRGLSVIKMAAPGKAIPDFLPDHRNLCSQIVWKEDVQCARNVDNGPGSHTFEMMLDLMGHRFPDMRVLQVGGVASLVSLVLHTLGSGTTPRLCSYLVLDETEDVFQTALAETAKDLAPLLSYERLVDKYNLTNTLKQQKFDVVLADSRIGIDRGVLLQALKPAGILAFTHESPTTNGVPGQDGVLRSYFKRETDRNDWVPASWYSLPQAYPAKMSTETVILLVQEDPYEFDYKAVPRVAALVSRLQSTAIGLSVKQMNLSAFRDLLYKEKFEPFDAYVIALFELHNDKGVVYDIESEHYMVIQELLQKTSKGILWVTAGAQMDTQQPTKSPFLGWARTVRSEEPDKQIICLDLEANNPHKKRRVGEETSSDTAVEDDVSTICDVFFRSFASTVSAAARDVEFAQRAGHLYIPRLEPLKEVNKLIEDDQEKIVHEVPSNKHKPLKLVRGASGALEDVYFKEDRGISRELLPHEVLIDVQECCLVPDSLNTISEDPDKAGYKTDLWGTVLKVGAEVKNISGSQKVIAIGCGAVGTQVIADQRFVWEDESSNSVLTHSPTCLITASFCLRVVNKGAKVLIHGAAGAHGQAAIQIAWQHGAEIFAVVSNKSERKALIKGGIMNGKHILNGDASLPERVARITSSKGMDFIFNPTADYREMDFRMVRLYGQVIHLTNSQSTPSHRDHCPDLLAEHFDIVYGWSQSTIQEPVLKQSYSFGDVRTAFKDLKTSPFSGVRMIRKVDKEKLPFGRIPRETYPAPLLSWKATYVVAGGFGGLGLDVIQWLADHGARHVTILSRSRDHGPATEKHLQGLLTRGLQRGGLRLVARTVDICCWDSCSAVIKSIEDGHPIGGIIQAAAVIKDGIYQNLTYDDWQAVTRVKTVGSYNLHKATEEFCPDLEFFVFLSSAAGIIGNLGQANYNAGNSFQDALARHRSSRGLHSVSIDLGPVLGAGMVAQDEALWDQLRAGGFIGVRLEDFHTVLERAITKPTLPSTSANLEQLVTAQTPEAFNCPPQVIMGVGTGGLVAQNKTTNPFWTRTPLFSYLNRVDVRPGSAASSSETGGGPTASLKPALKAASSRAEAANLLLPYFVRALAEVMGKNHAEIDPDSILDDHGPDSLRMKEILDWIFSATGVKVSGINQMPIRSICAQVCELGGFGGED